MRRSFQRRVWIAAALALACGALIFTGYAIWRGRPRVVRGVAYGVAGGQALLVDVVRPAGLSTDRPAVILIHGGAWCSGGRADLQEVARGLARAGFVCFSVDYRLASQAGNKYPAQLDDVQHAVRWVRASAKTYGVDRDRIGAFGHSAGGHLAALLGTRENHHDSDPSLDGISSRVDCVVDTCGPTDFTDPQSPPLFPQLMFVLEIWLGWTREQAPDTYRDASPVAHVGPRTAPFLIVHGTEDDVVPFEQSQRFHDALRSERVDATLVSLKGAGHIFHTDALRARWLSESVAFLHRHLGYAR